jgi:putative integral membrane protein (TIGR02587 family)
MLMTMELWWLGFYIDRIRFGLFLVFGLSVVAMISFYEGIADTFGGKDDILDTLISFFVGFSLSALMLVLFGVVGPSMSIDEILGKIGLQAIPASFGAVLGEAVLGTSGETGTETRRTSYMGQLVLAVAGAVFLGMSVSPTEEIQLIAHSMSLWHTLALALFTLLLTHSFIYASNRGQEDKTKASFFDPGLIFRFTGVTYAAVLLVSMYILWTFGTLDGMDTVNVVKSTCVLSFPAALGASASRLIL